MSFVTLERKGQKGQKAPAQAAPPRAGRGSRTLPSVNLLSPSMLERMAVLALRKRFVAGGLALSVVVGGGWMLQNHRLHSAEERLAAEVAMRPALQQQVDALAPVAAYYAAMEMRKVTASAAMATEVLFSAALADLKNRTPAGMAIQNLGVTLTAADVEQFGGNPNPIKEAFGSPGQTGTSAGKTGTTAGGPSGTSPDPAPAATRGAALGGAKPADAPAEGVGEDGGTAKPATPVAPPAQAVACARPDPFNLAPIIGCVTLSGTADSRAVVGEFINSLKAGDMYADPFVTTTSIAGADGEQSVQYSGSVGLTGKAVSGRYADLRWLSDPSVLAKAERLIASGETASARWAAQAKRDAAAAKAKAEAEAAAEAAAAAAAQAAAEAEAARQIQEAAQAAAAAAALAEANRNGGSR